MDYEAAMEDVPIEQRISAIEEKIGLKEEREKWLEKVDDFSKNVPEIEISLIDPLHRMVIFDLPGRHKIDSGPIRTGEEMFDECYIMGGKLRIFD